MEKYKFISENTDKFTKNKIYYVRNGKRGTKKFLTTDIGGIELQIQTSGLSVISSYNQSFLKKHFEFIEVEFFNNYKDFRKNIKGTQFKKRKGEKQWDGMKDLE